MTDPPTNHIGTKTHFLSINSNEINQIYQSHLRIFHFYFWHENSNSLMTSFILLPSAFMKSLIDSGFMINHHQNFFHVPQKSVIIYFLTNFFGLLTSPFFPVVAKKPDASEIKLSPQWTPKPSPLNQPDDSDGTATPHSKTWAFFRIYFYTGWSTLISTQ